MTTNIFFHIFLIGIGATICMDLWAFFQKHLLRIPSLNYALVGRWILWMTKGKFFHNKITNTPSIFSEKYVGWSTHYLIGIIFAVIPIIISGIEWLDKPTLVSGLLTGLLSTIAPFIIMQPMFGFGLAASKTPSPLKSRILSITAHSIYGLGLFFTAKLISHI